MAKKIEILNTYTGIQKADGTPYFHIEYLIDHVLKLSSEEKEENRRYWIKDGAGAGSSEATPGEGGEGAEPGGEFGGEFGGEAGGEAPETGGETPEAGGEAGGESPEAGGEAGGEFEF